MPAVRPADFLPLGKLPAQPGAIKFALWSYFKPDLVKTPSHFRHADPPPWQDYANTKYGTCVWAGAANETSLWEHEGGRPQAKFTEDTVLYDYAAVTGFNPKNKKTDNGTSMAKAAAYRRKTGIIDDIGNRHTIDAYAWCRLRDMDYFKAALYQLGALGLGFEFPEYAMAQFKQDKPWSVQAGGIGGGHYVPAVGIAANGNIICVSWGKEQEMTPEFYIRYADEVTAYLDLDRLVMTSKLSPEGFDEARLRHDLGLVASGRVYALNDRPRDDFPTTGFA